MYIAGVALAFSVFSLYVAWRALVRADDAAYDTEMLRRIVDRRLQPRITVDHGVELVEYPPVAILPSPARRRDDTPRTASPPPSPGATG